MDMIRNQQIEAEIRLFEVIADWVHAVFNVVALPVLAGWVVASRAGQSWGLGVFLAFAALGAWVVRSRGELCRCPECSGGGV